MSSFSYDLPSYATSRPVHMNMDLCENKTLPLTILKQLVIDPLLFICILLFHLTQKSFWLRNTEYYDDNLKNCKHTYVYSYSYVYNYNFFNQYVPKYGYTKYSIHDIIM